MREGRPWVRAVLVAGLLALAAYGEAPVVLASPRSEVSGGADGAVAAREPWLGVRVAKAPEEVYRLLADVPEGVGFIVEGVSEGGPAYAAGIRRHDFIWKLADQLLVNEAQMLVLLSHREVGEKVSLTLQRSGKNREVEVELGGRPESEKGREEADMQVLTPRDPRMPMQVVNLERRIAEIRDGSGTVRIERAGGQFGWEARDGAGRLLEQGQISGAEEGDLPEGMDPGVARKLRVLVRAFEHAEQRAANPGRRPRIRRIPVPGDERP